MQRDGSARIQLSKTIIATKFGPLLRGHIADTVRITEKYYIFWTVVASWTEVAQCFSYVLSSFPSPFNRYVSEKFSDHRHIFIIFNTDRKVVYKNYICMFIICLHTKFHYSVSSNSLSSVVRLEDKCRIRPAAWYYLSLYWKCVELNVKMLACPSYIKSWNIPYRNLWRYHGGADIKWLHFHTKCHDNASVFLKLLEKGHTPTQADTSTDTMTLFL
jgi:hypothetical protein